MKKMLAIMVVIIGWIGSVSVTNAASPPAVGNRAAGRAAGNAQAITPEDLQRYNALSQEMGKAFAAKDYEKMAKVSQEQAKIAKGLDQGRANYNLARSQALAGHKDEAFKALNHAIDEGLRDPNMIKNDKWLKGLRGDKRFDEAIKKAKQLSKSGGAR
jgi:hypothetical protein